MTTPAERAAAIAQQSRGRADVRIEQAIAREWWTVNKPGGESVEVFMCPAQTAAEMRRLYHSCGVLPL